MAISFRQAIQMFRMSQASKHARKVHESIIQKKIEEVNLKKHKIVEIRTITGWEAFECADPIGTVKCGDEIRVYIPPVYEHQPVHYFNIMKVMDLRIA